MGLLVKFGNVRDDKYMADQANDTGSSMADAQAAAAPSLSDVDQKMVAAFHGSQEFVKVAIRSLLHMESAQGEAQTQVSTEGKRRHASETDDQSRAKRARTSKIPLGPEPIDLYSIRNPEFPIYCMIQVNWGVPMGSLDTCEVGYSIRVFIDGGRRGPPSIGLQFRNSGSGGREIGCIIWHVDSRAEDRWIIDGLEYRLVMEFPQDTAINHPAVINHPAIMNRPDGSQAVKRLMCITLKLTAKTGATCRRPADGTTQATKTCLSTIFFNKKDYTLRIWFLVPWANRLDIDSRCLSVIQYSLNNRRKPLSHIWQTDGVYHADVTEGQRFTFNPRVPVQQRTRQASRQDATSDDIGMSTGPTAAGVRDMPRFIQKDEAARPTFRTNQRRVMNTQHPHVNRAVPSFGLDLPIVSAKANAPSMRGDGSRPTAATDTFFEHIREQSPSHQPKRPQ